MPRAALCQCGICRRCKDRAKYHSMTIEQKREREARVDRDKKRATNRAYYRRHREKCLAYSAAWAERNKDRVIAANKAWAERNREKKRAQNAVTNAVRDGRLRKDPCEVCGSTYRTHGHHEDYTKPLEVIWLCYAHHRERHGFSI